MKTAIIFSGAMRSFAKCYPNIEWMVLRHFPGARVFVGTHDDEDAGSANILEAKHPGTLVKKFTQPAMVAPHGCPETFTLGRHYMHEPFAISVEPKAVLGQLWINRQAWALYEESDFKAEKVIRIRPDLWFHHFEPVLATCSSDAYVPWWGSFGGVNDRFAILGPEAAASYFKAYDRIAEYIQLGAPLHPETMVHTALSLDSHWIHRTLRTEFSTVRKNGEFRAPEITPWDMAAFRCN